MGGGGLVISLKKDGATIRINNPANPLQAKELARRLHLINEGPRLPGGQNFTGLFWAISVAS